MTDVADIAGRLTKRSRRAIVLIGIDWTDEGWGETKPHPNDVYSLGWGKDRNRDLVTRRLKPGTGVPCKAAQFQWRLTSLGAQIRAHIQGNSHD